MNTLPDLQHAAILLPNLGMVLLTALVWVALYVERLGEMRQRGIPAQALATSAQRREHLARTSAADNFRNLFEVPVLFYLGTLTVFVLGLADPLYVCLAWLFVALRWLHSLIHLTVNRVMARFTVYVLSTLVVWVFWGRLALAVLAP